MSKILRLKIEYALNNVEEILNKTIDYRKLSFIEFVNSYKKLILKKPKENNILKLKDKLESLKSIFEVKFNNCLVYKELLFLCENLKSTTVNFDNCSFEKGTEKEILKLFNNCEKLKVYNKMDKILFFVIKNYFSKVKDKKLRLELDSLKYYSIKNIFFGMYLNILNLSDLKTNRREMTKILKSLHTTKSLSIFEYESRKAYGLIHQLEQDVEENYFNMIFKPNANDENKIFLSSLPPWLSKVKIRTSYKKEHFQLLLTKFYKQGVLHDIEHFNNYTFGYLPLINKTYLKCFKYVLKIKYK